MVFPDIFPSWRAIIDALQWINITVNPLALVHFILKLLLNIKNFFVGLQPYQRRKKRFIKWLSDVLDVDIPNLETVWRDGSLLCALVNTAYPGSCLVRVHSTRTIYHAQCLVERHFGVLPAFTESDLQDLQFTKSVEHRLICYLQNIKRVMEARENKQVRKNEDQLDDNLNEQAVKKYILKGMGLVTATQACKATFYIYLTSEMYFANLIVQIHGPGGSFGKADISNRAEKVLSPKETHDIQISFKICRECVEVCYVPCLPGAHDLCITDSGHHIIGSPYMVMVEKLDSKKIESKNLSMNPIEKQSNKRKRKLKKLRVVSRIVDFINEKMILTENGELKKLPSVKYFSSNPESENLRPIEMSGKTINDVQQKRNYKNNLNDCAIVLDQSVKTNNSEYREEIINIVTDKPIYLNEETVKLFNDINHSEAFSTDKRVIETSKTVNKNTCLSKPMNNNEETKSNERIYISDIPTVVNSNIVGGQKLAYIIHNQDNEDSIFQENKCVETNKINHVTKDSLKRGRGCNNNENTSSEINIFINVPSENKKNIFDNSGKKSQSFTIAEIMNSGNMSERSKENYDSKKYRNHKKKMIRFNTIQTISEVNDEESCHTPNREKELASKLFEEIILGNFKDENSLSCIRRDKTKPNDSIFEVNKNISEFELPKGVILNEINDFPHNNYTKSDSQCRNNAIEGLDNNIKTDKSLSYDNSSPGKLENSKVIKDVNITDTTDKKMSVEIETERKINIVDLESALEAPNLETALKILDGMLTDKTDGNIFTRDNTFGEYNILIQKEHAPGPFDNENSHKYIQNINPGCSHVKATVNIVDKQHFNKNICGDYMAEKQGNNTEELEKLNKNKEDYEKMNSSFETQQFLPVSSNNTDKSLVPEDYISENINNDCSYENSNKSELNEKLSIPLEILKSGCSGVDQNYCNVTDLADDSNFNLIYQKKSISPEMAEQQCSGKGCFLERESKEDLLNKEETLVDEEKNEDIKNLPAKSFPDSRGAIEEKCVHENVLLSINNTFPGSLKTDSSKSTRHVNFTPNVSVFNDFTTDLSEHCDLQDEKSNVRWRNKEQCEISASDNNNTDVVCKENIIVNNNDDERNYSNDNQVSEDRTNNSNISFETCVYNYKHPYNTIIHKDPLKDILNPGKIITTSTIQVNNLSENILKSDDTADNTTLLNNAEVAEPFSQNNRNSEKSVPEKVEGKSKNVDRGTSKEVNEDLDDSSNITTHHAEPVYIHDLNKNSNKETDSEETVKNNKSSCEEGTYQELYDDSSNLFNAFHTVNLNDKNKIEAVNYMESESTNTVSDDTCNSITDTKDDGKESKVDRNMVAIWTEYWNNVLDEKVTKNQETVRVTKKKSKYFSLPTYCQNNVNVDGNSKSRYTMGSTKEKEEEKVDQEIETNIQVKHVLHRGEEMPGNTSVNDGSLFDQQKRKPLQKAGSNKSNIEEKLFHPEVRKNNESKTSSLTKKMSSSLNFPKELCSDDTEINSFRTRFQAAKNFFETLEKTDPPIQGTKPFRTWKVKSSDLWDENITRRRHRSQKMRESHSAPGSDSESTSNTQNCNEFSGGSERLKKVSDRFHVNDIFHDIIGESGKKRSFLPGIPHSQAVLAVMRSIEVENKSNT